MHPGRIFPLNIHFLTELSGLLGFHILASSDNACHACAIRIPSPTMGPEDQTRRKEDPSHMTASPQFDFSACFERLAGMAHSVPTKKAAAEKIISIFKSKKARCVALAGLSAELVAEIEKGCKGIQVLKEPYAAKDLPEAIDKADVGVTGIEFAIAQSGTLVETTTNDATRLVSGLPRTYIGVLKADTVVDKFEDGAARLRQIVQQHDDHLVISFISGPSRTGDIELKLTLGVHGPEEAHAILIGK